MHFYRIVDFLMDAVRFVYNEKCECESEGRDKCVSDRFNILMRKKSARNPFYDRQTIEPSLAFHDFVV